MDNCYMMGEVNSINENFWSAEVNINNNTCDFKLDSGSKVTIVGDTALWIRGLKLDKITSEFRGPGGVKLPHLFRGQITNAQFETHIENVYVMRNQPNNLLSKSAIQALQLLTPAPTVYNVESAPDFRAEFPKLFKGLGQISKAFHT